MIREAALSLSSGTLVSVVWGNHHGEQIAVILRPTRSGKLRVCKFMLSSRRWTQPVCVEPERIIERLGRISPGFPLPADPRPFIKEQA
jgi:hypothetical protein